MPAKKKAQAPHQFLSAEWIAAVKQLRAEYDERIEPPSIAVRANVVVTAAPFGDDPIHGHIDTSAGGLTIETGHLDAVDLTITTDYATAYSLFVAQDPNAAMQAVMTGKIRVSGDTTKLLAMQLPLTEARSAELTREIAERIRALTA